MNRIIIFAIVISASLLLSCKDNRTYKNKLNVHYENLEPQVLEIKSYNSALFELDTANFDEELKSIQNEYSLFIGDNLDNPAAITYIRNFVTDTFCIRINEMVEQKFKDKSSLNKDIRSVYQRFSYYYPEIELPQPYFYISGIDYETPTVIVAPEGVAISLDYYLTNDDKIYDYVGMPRFRSSSAAISGDISILGTTIFSLAANASGKPFKAAKGINCFALSCVDILVFGLFATAVSSNLLIPFSGGSVLFQIHSLYNCVSAKLFTN